MVKQVLILNITRMGDVFQMSPLLARLDEEWPGVKIDLIVDKEFANVASLVPGIRHVLAYDFQQLLDDCRAKVRDVVSLYQDVASWAKPLLQVGYDRIINLTFNRRSAFLTRYLGSADVRGMTTTAGGHFIVRNPWMKYFLDFQQHRQLNRFNIVDLFALGGSGVGTFHPLRLQLPGGDDVWARNFLSQWGRPQQWIGVQIGASDPMKAWRPVSYGHFMATLSARLPVGFVLIGTRKEEPAIQEAMQAYRRAGGTAPLCEAFGKTSVGELLALLAECALMVSNDTGPMHMAVGIQTPVVNVSVGHVDFRETGPYGPGHWVIQPDIACGPCGFDRVCPHHACKDQIEPHAVADLCVYLLTQREFPKFPSGIRVYEGCVDEDHLGNFRLKAGAEEVTLSWYAQFWRTFWFDIFTGRSSQVPLEVPKKPVDTPDRKDWDQWFKEVEGLRDEADRVARLCRRRPVPVSQLQMTQSHLKEHTADILRKIKHSWALGPLATAFFRETHNLQAGSLEEMAEEHALAYRLFYDRLSDVRRRVAATIDEPREEICYASTIGS